MLNLTIGSLQLSRITDKSPLLSRRLNNLNVNNAHISKSFASFIRMTSIKNMKIQNTQLGLFYQTPIYVSSAETKYYSNTTLILPENETIYLTNCFFYKCYSDENSSAAIYYAPETEHSNLTVHYSTFWKMRIYSDYGSIYCRCGNFDMDLCCFKQCYTNIGRGVILNCEVSNTTSISNSCAVRVGRRGGPDYTGGQLISSKGDAMILTCLNTSHTASTGIGIFEFKGKTFSLSESDFINISCDTSCFLIEANSTISGCNFFQVKADTLGSFVGSALLSKCFFQEVRAKLATASNGEAVIEESFTTESNYSIGSGAVVRGLERHESLPAAPLSTEFCFANEIRDDGYNTTWFGVTYQAPLVIYVFAGLVVVVLGIYCCVRGKVKQEVVPEKNMEPLTESEWSDKEGIQDIIAQVDEDVETKLIP